MSEAVTGVSEPVAELPAEERLSVEDTAGAQYDALLRKLSALSVTKCYDPYVDIDWDAPEMRVDRTDPRWELSPMSPLARTEWYRAQPPEIRSAVGLNLTAKAAKLGLEFEAVLKRGLLHFASTLPNGSPEYRYVMHEAVEEARHAMMFQELVNRSGFDVRGIPPWERFGSEFVVIQGRFFPELFFLFVLGGEDPIDYVQRVVMRDKPDMHPLMRRISRIHITEEARHLTFARNLLRRRVPKLGRVKMARLRVVTPILFGKMTGMMLKPSRRIVHDYGIPEDTLREAYGGEVYREWKLGASAKICELCEELEILTPRTRPLWKRMRLV